MIQDLYRLTGTVHFRERTCYATFDKETAKYYYSLIPKYKNVKTQRYSPHITIVREFEKPNRRFFQDRLNFNGLEISYYYSPIILNDRKYYYLNVYSLEIEELRVLFGLKRFRFNCFHVTIGNTK